MPEQSPIQQREKVLHVHPEKLTIILSIIFIVVLFGGIVYAASFTKSGFNPTSSPKPTDNLNLVQSSSLESQNVAGAATSSAPPQGPITPIQTPKPTTKPKVTPKPTQTATSQPTQSPTNSPTPTPSPTSNPESTPSPTNSPSPSPELSPSPNSTPSPSPTTSP